MGVASLLQQMAASRRNPGPPSGLALAPAAPVRLLKQDWSEAPRARHQQSPPQQPVALQCFVLVKDQAEHLGGVSAGSWRGSLAGMARDARAGEQNILIECDRCSGW